MIRETSQRRRNFLFRQCLPQAKRTAMIEGHLSLRSRNEAAPTRLAAPASRTCRRSTPAGNLVSDDSWTGFLRCGCTDDVEPVAVARLLCSYAAPQEKGQYACQDRYGNEQRDRGYHASRLWLHRAPPNVRTPAPPEKTQRACQRRKA